MTVLDALSGTGAAVNVVQQETLVGGTNVEGNTGSIRTTTLNYVNADGHRVEATFKVFSPGVETGQIWPATYPHSPQVTVEYS